MRLLHSFQTSWRTTTTTREMSSLFHKVWRNICVNVYKMFVGRKYHIVDPTEHGCRSFIYYDDDYWYCIGYTIFRELLFVTSNEEVAASKANKVRKIGRAISTRQSFRCAAGDAMNLTRVFCLYINYKQLIKRRTIIIKYTKTLYIYIVTQLMGPTYIVYQWENSE